MADNLGTLYTVSTPIGNLEDITLRAINTLKSVQIIAAEDTRTTSVLLNKYNITTRLVSYHKFSNEKKVDEIISSLLNGNDIALVSDAGTPLISDPGDDLLLKAYENNIKVVPIVGASAVTALISSIPKANEDFKFIGFLKRNKNEIIGQIEKNRFENLVFYESPKRILDTLKIIYDNFPDKKIAIGRELTKKFEEIKVFQIKDAFDYFAKNAPKGEFALMLYKDIEKKDEINIDEKIKKLRQLNYSNKDIANILSNLFEINKNEIKKILTAKPEQHE